jgi:2,3-dihydroxy-p-cumate/2,3-dihydroxybenzoate 3,4-dioxygenase
MRIRSIELEVPDRRAAIEFLKHPWGLLEAGERNKTSYLRGTGDHPYVLSVTEAAEPAIAAVTFSGSAAELDMIRSRAAYSNIRIEGETDEFDEPGRAAGFLVRAPEGQIFRCVTEKERAEALPPSVDRPLGVTHVVLNAVDLEGCARFAVEVLGFRLSDSTNHMNFLRCDQVHHALAFAKVGLSSLNHIAFEMTDIDAVMRGIGRLKDAGIDSAWGPGRHGPGNNVFAYFRTPFGAIMEYTSEILRIDDSYKAGGPDDWKWPPNRNDLWGIATRDSFALDEGGKQFLFR